MEVEEINIEYRTVYGKKRTLTLKIDVTGLNNQWAGKIYFRGITSIDNEIIEITIVQKSIIHKLIEEDILLDDRIKLDKKDLIFKLENAFNKYSDRFN